MGWNPVKEAEKKANKAIDKIIKPAVESGKKVLSAAEKGAEARLRKAGQGIEDGLTKKLPGMAEDAVKDLLSKAGSGAAKKALDMACDIIETTAPDTYTLTFGVELALIVQGEVTVSLEIPNPVARLSQIRKWAEKPPHGRAQIIECVKDFAPESLTVEAKVSGNGGSATYSGEHIYDGVNSFLEKNGVD